MDLIQKLFCYSTYFASSIKILLGKNYFYFSYQFFQEEMNGERNSLTMVETLNS